jgi:5-methyltetrahydropteroyltriglutamate--homocysteine methyltransferase
VREHAYRSAVVGSLLRPAYLKEARTRYEANAISAADFKKIEDRAVDDAIALQIRAGVEVITDGEMRRDTFFGHLIDAVEGFDRLGGGAVSFRDEHGGEVVFRRPVVTSRLRRRRHMCATGDYRTPLDRIGRNPGFFERGVPTILPFGADTA